MHAETLGEVANASDSLQLQLDRSEHADLPMRAYSCPPKLAEQPVNELADQFQDLSTALPMSDPVGFVPSDPVYIYNQPIKSSGITVENSQTVLSPDACLFIAK